MTTGRVVADEAAALSARASEIALCLDFDGTLAPIVDDPAASAPVPGIPALLASLAKRYAAVALVSGRPATFLAERAAAAGVRFLGLYGLQEIRDGALWIDPRLLAAHASVVAATADLADAAAVRASGAHVEDKGYAVAVHTRRVAEPDRWAAEVDETVRIIAARRNLEVILGKLVWELRPPVHDDKGDAVRRIARESAARSVIVVGDDLGDLPAFTVAAELGESGYPSFRVAVNSPEMPAALLEQADYVVEGPDGVYDFLTLLL